MFSRVLCDSERQEGVHAILSCFPYETDKQAAMSILGTVSTTRNTPGSVAGR